MVACKSCVDRFVDGLEAERIGCSVSVSGFDSSSGHPNGKPMVIVIAAIDLSGVGSGFGQFHSGRSSELSSPKHQGLFQKPPLLEVREQGTDGLVAFLCQSAVVLFDFIMTVPGLGFYRARVERIGLLVPRVGGPSDIVWHERPPRRIPESFEVPWKGVKGIACLHLHAVSQFEGTCSRLQAVVGGPQGGMMPIEFCKQLELGGLSLDRTRGVEVGNDFVLRLAGRVYLSPPINSW